ncbi:MAG TPA: hypothetical protein VE913_23270 [Longimicrobium sp.]|nr:hypothetical protein [Longimicrobium sp.]
MSRNRDRKPQPRPSAPSAIEEARNELFSHVHRCGVMRAEREQQVDWMKDTVEFLSERYPGLKPADLEELHGIGMRFCSPVIANPQAGSPAESSVEEPETESAAA